MRRGLALGALFASLVVGGAAALAEEPGIANPGFEEGSAGEVPQGWHAPAAAQNAGYRARTSEKDPAEGRRCLEIALEGPGEKNAFGNAMQVIDATSLRGKCVRLSARLRASGGGQALMWFRVDRAEGRVGFFDNMSDRPIVAASWKEAEIVGDVDEDATAVALGVMLQGTGTAGADAFRLEVLGTAEKVVVEPARPLTPEGLANVVAFTRLLGCVRHFHPSDEAAAADWDRVAIEGVRAIEAAKSPRELAAALRSVFEPLAPTVRIEEAGAGAGAAATPPPARPAEAVSVLAWNHLGFGGSGRNSIYQSRRIPKPLAGDGIPPGTHDPGAPFEADLGAGVRARVPLAVFADGQGSLPHAAAPAAKRPRVRTTGDDRATRLADVAIAWNILQHFYPYFDVVETDWGAALETALRSAATDAGEVAFLSTLRRLVAALRDGHGNVYATCDPRTGILPVCLGWVEESLVLTQVGPGVDGRLVRGTVVEKIDGRGAADALAALEEEISSATPQWRRHRSLQVIATGPAGTRAKLECRAPSGERFAAELEFAAGVAPPRETRPEPIAEVAEGVMYVDIDRVTTKEYVAALPRLTKARGVVIDFRGYPSRLDAHWFFAHLVEKPVTSPQWRIPRFREPDRRGVTFVPSHWTIMPRSPRITAPLAFLTGGGAISAAESNMGIVENYRLGAIVGGPTAGTNGNINPFPLPGGYSVVWTGMEVLKHDGSRHHGVGIQPTVPVARTLAGVAAGRDEVLERATELLKQ